MANLAENTDPTHADGDWYVRSFGELYPLVYRHRDDESARLEVHAAVKLLGLRAGSRVLDVACGTGRHLAPLVAGGFHAIGVDLSPCMLKLAAERPGFRGRLVRADMRALPFESSFDAALCLFTSFGYFLDDRENLAALGQMTRALKRGGSLLLDLMHRRVVEATLVPHSRREIDGAVVESHRRITGDRVVNETVVTPAGTSGGAFGGTSGGASGGRCTESVRLYHPEELKPMLEAAGLTAIRFHGSLAGDPLGDASTRLIVTGARA